MSQSLHFSRDRSKIYDHGIERLLNFQVHFDYIEIMLKI